MDINTFSWLFVPSFIFGEMVIRNYADWRAKDWRYPFKDILVNFSIGMIDRLVTKLLWTVIMYQAFVYIHSNWTSLRVDMSSWWAWPLAILLSDLAFYCYHRAGHELRLFWAIHNVHHSSQHYNFSTSIRLSWFEGLFRWPFWIILPLTGFSAEVSMTAYLAVRLYQVLLHTEAVGKLGWLEYILSTPSHHRVHHGRNEEYLDKNYGGVTIIWDRLFGTFAEEQEKVDYGLVKQLDSHNLIWINAQEFVNLYNDIRSASRLTDKVCYLFKKPGWAPVDAETLANEANASDLIA